MFNKSPNYDFLRVFGCLVYASVHESDKFAPRAIRGVLVGYPPGQKGYKILDLQTHHIFVFRHVVFHETSFPYLTKTDHSQKSDPHCIMPWLDNLNDGPVNHITSSDLSSEINDASHTEHFVLNHPPPYNSDIPSSHIPSNDNIVHNSELSESSPSMSPPIASVPSRISTRPRQRPI